MMELDYPQLRESLALHWHDGGAFRLIDARQWRSLIRRTEADLTRSVQRLLDQLVQVDEQFRDQYRFWFERRKLFPVDSILLMKIAGEMNLVPPALWKELRRANQLGERLAKGERELRGESLASPALAFFLATENVVARVRDAMQS